MLCRQQGLLKLGGSPIKTSVSEGRWQRDSLAGDVCIGRDLARHVHLLVVLLKQGKGRFLGIGSYFWFQVRGHKKSRV